MSVRKSGPTYCLITLSAVASSCINLFCWVDPSCSGLVRVPSTIVQIPFATNAHLVNLDHRLQFSNPMSWSVVDSIDLMVEAQLIACGVMVFVWSSNSGSFQAHSL